MRRVLAAITMLACVACGGSTRQSSPAAPTGDLGETLRVSGRVHDYSTGGGVSGVTVAFGDASAVTDGSGRYSLSLTETGTYYPTVDGQRVGTTHFTGASYRGDFLVRSGTCVARYGTVSDAESHKPVFGAMLSLGGKITGTGPDGWYRVDFGCPSEAWIGFNTTFIYASHADYMDTSQIVGRGIAGVLRLDIEMQHK
jgi:hypothetical protein